MRQFSLQLVNLEWHAAPAPRIGADTNAMVRPLTVARCGLDCCIARGVVNYRGPFAFGHETIAEAVACSASPVPAVA